MTKQELIQYVIDRIFTNDSFEVSALDIQESIVQVIEELYDKDNSTIPNLQQVLDEGSVADLTAIGNIILTAAGRFNNISNQGNTLSESSGGNSIIIERSFDKFISRNDSKVGGSVSLYENDGIGEKLNVTGTEFGFTASVDNTHTINGKSESISSLDGLTTLEKKHNPSEIKYTGKFGVPSRFYNFVVGVNGADMSADSSSYKYHIHFDPLNSNSGKGAGCWGVSSSSADYNDFTPLATWGIDGNLHVGVIEEETQDVEFELVTDSTGVIKKVPSQSTKTEKLSGTLSHNVTERKNYTVSPENSGETVVNLPSTSVYDSALEGRWAIYNDGSNSGTVRISQTGTNALPDILLASNETVVLECVKIETGTNAYIYNFIEIGKR